MSAYFLESNIQPLNCHNTSWNIMYNEKYSQDVKVNSNSFISISQYFNVVKSKRVKLIYYFLWLSPQLVWSFFSKLAVLRSH